MSDSIESAEKRVLRAAEVLSALQTFTHSAPSKAAHEAVVVATAEAAAASAAYLEARRSAAP